MRVLTGCTSTLSMPMNGMSTSHPGMVLNNRFNIYTMPQRAGVPYSPPPILPIAEFPVENPNLFLGSQSRHGILWL